MSITEIKRSKRNSAEDDLAYIRKIMKDANEKVYDSSFFFILFGSLVVIATIINRILLLLGKSSLIVFLWLIVMGIGVVVAALKSAKIGKSVQSLAGRVLSATWLSVLIISLVIGFSLALIGKLTLSLGLGIASAGLGLGFFISSVVSGSKLLLFLSIPWWLGGIFIPFIGDHYGPFIMIGLTVFFELIPGIVIKVKKTRPRVANG